MAFCSPFQKLKKANKSEEVYEKLTMPYSRRRLSEEPEIKLSEKGETLQTEDGEEILDYTNKANGIISLAKDGDVQTGDQSEMEKHCLKLLDGVWAG